MGKPGAPCEPACGCAAAGCWAAIRASPGLQHTLHNGVCHLHRISRAPARPLRRGAQPGRLPGGAAAPGPAGPHRQLLQQRQRQLGRCKRRDERERGHRLAAVPLRAARAPARLQRPGGAGDHAPGQPVAGGGGPAAQGECEPDRRWLGAPRCRLSPRPASQGTRHADRSARPPLPKPLCRRRTSAPKHSRPKAKSGGAAPRCTTNSSTPPRRSRWRAPTAGPAATPTATAAGRRLAAALAGPRRSTSSTWAPACRARASTLGTCARRTTTAIAGCGSRSRRSAVVPVVPLSVRRRPPLTPGAAGLCCAAAAARALLTPS